MLALETSPTLTPSINQRQRDSNLQGDSNAFVRSPFAGSSSHCVGLTGASPSGRRSPKRDTSWMAGLAGGLCLRAWCRAWVRLPVGRASPTHGILTLHATRWPLIVTEPAAGGESRSRSPVGRARPRSPGRLSRATFLRRISPSPAATAPDRHSTDRLGLAGPPRGALHSGHAGNAPPGVTRARTVSRNHALRRLPVTSGNPDVPAGRWSQPDLDTPATDEAGVSPASDRGVDRSLRWPSRVPAPAPERRTVAEVLDQVGAAAESRLKPLFERARVPSAAREGLPPGLQGGAAARAVSRDGATGLPSSVPTASCRPRRVQRRAQGR